MGSFTGQTIAATYKRILTIPSENLASGTGAQYIEDGDGGTISCLSIGTTAIGIGTDSPDYLLDVEASGDSTLRIYTSSGATDAVLRLQNSDRAWQVFVDGNDAEKFKIGDITAAGTRLTINSSGNVGIGSATPGARLHTYAALEAPSDLGDFDNYQFIIQGHADTGDTAGMLFATSADTYGGSAIVHYDTDNGGKGELVFYTKQSTSAEPPVEVMRLDDNGKVGIGTSTPESLLELEGEAPKLTITHDHTNEADSGGIWFREDVAHNMPGESSSYGIYLKMNGIAEGGSGGALEFVGYDNNVATTGLVQTRNGNVGIGTTDPACKLEVAGAIAGQKTAFSTAGPTDDVDVSGTTMLSCNTTSNSVTIGGLAGGVSGQVLYVAKLASANDLTLEHQEGGATQQILLCTGADETVTTYGGWILVCNGTSWVAVSSPTGAVDA